jgi:hypothetical protein
MFNLGSSDTCARLGERIVRYAYLGETKIYTCGQCDPTGTTDPYFSAVLFLANFNGNYFNCALNDATLSRRSWVSQPPVLSNTVYYTTPDVEYPEEALQGSLDFNGNGLAWANLTTALGLEFTVEAWAYRTTNLNYYNDPNLIFFALFEGTGDAVQYLAGPAAVGVRNNVWILNGVGTAASAPISTWQHVALVGRARLDSTSAGDLTLYIDGVEAAKQQYQAIKGNYGVATPIQRVTLGFGNGPEISAPFVYSFPGYMDDLRVTNRARYLSNFTPPVSPMPNDQTPAILSSSSSSSASDPYFNNVEVLLHCDADAPAIARIRDSSQHNRTIYLANILSVMINTQASNQSPIGQNQSASSQRGVLTSASQAWSDYSGGAYIQAAITGNNLSAGSRDYTLEFWAKFSGGGTIISPAVGFGLGQNRLFIRDAQEPWAGYAQRMTMQLQYLSPTAGVGIVNRWAHDVTPYRNTWTHYAISRANGTTRVFVNGQQVTLGIDSATQEPWNPFSSTAASINDGVDLNFSSSPYFTSYGSDAMALFGVGYDQMANTYIDEFRYTVGVGRYTTGFTVPTVPYPNS